MRREELFVRDIVEAVSFVAEVVAGLSRDAFGESEPVRSAVVHKLAILGEATTRIPVNIAARYTEIPWPKIVAFRNILVPTYFGIDWDEVWRAATREAPALKLQNEALLRAEFGEKNSARVMAT